MNLDIRRIDWELYITGLLDIRIIDWVAVKDRVLVALSASRY